MVVCQLCVCACVYTSSPRVNSRVVLIVEVWLIQVGKGLKLQLSVLEEIQFGEEGQTHKPELEHTHTHMQTHRLWFVKCIKH